MPYEGSASKLEFPRNQTAYFTFWPRKDGAMLPLGSAPPIVTIYDPQGVQLADSDHLSVDTPGDGSITFMWQLTPNFALGEDYFADIIYADATPAAHHERLYFDVVIKAFECPVDESHLKAREPRLDAVLQAANLGDPRAYIAAAWDEVVRRVRAQGFRPALLTEAGVFTAFVTARSLEFLYRAAIKGPQDLADRKQELYHEEASEAWDLIGPLKFETMLGDIGVSGQRSSLPRFSI